MNLRCGTTTAVLTMLVLTSSGTALSQERFPDPPPGHGLYSDAVQVGDLVFLSGVVSGDPDPAQQFRNIFERLDQILREAGSGLDRIVDMTTYHIDMHEHIQDFIEVKVIAAAGDGG